MDQLHLRTKPLTYRERGPPDRLLAQLGLEKLAMRPSLTSCPSFPEHALPLLHTAAALLSVPCCAVQSVLLA